MTGCEPWCSGTPRQRQRTSEQRNTMLASKDDKHAAGHCAIVKSKNCETPANLQIKHQKLSSMSICWRQVSLPTYLPTLPYPIRTILTPDGQKLYLPPTPSDGSKGEVWIPTFLFLTLKLSNLHSWATAFISIWLTVNFTRSAIFDTNEAWTPSASFYDQSYLL